MTKEICPDIWARRAEKEESIVKTDDPTTCPRCGSTDVGWCGGDGDGSGGYYHMYLCESCGRLPKGVQVFLVPCSKEDYGRDPLAPPRDPNEVLSMGMKEMDFGFEEEEGAS